MARRFEKFSERARRALTYAQEEAQRFNHNYIGTEHILLGLVRESDGVAAKVLTNLDIDLNKVRSAVEFIMGRGGAEVVRILNQGAAQGQSGAKSSSKTPTLDQLGHDLTAMARADKLD